MTMGWRGGKARREKEAVGGGRARMTPFVHPLC